MTTELPKRVQIGRLNLPFRTVQTILRIVAVLVIVWIVWTFPPIENWPMWLCAAGWIGFSIYWGKAAKNSAESKSSESSRSRRVHLLLTTVGELLLFIPVIGLQQVFLPPARWWVPVGLALLTLSIALAVWARQHLAANWSGRIEIKQNHELVRTGPYRKLRHPIYTAVIGMCVGTALVDGRVHSLVGLLLVIVAYWRKTRMEEAKLRQAFGAGYDEYRRATWGAIPGLL